MDDVIAEFVTGACRAHGVESPYNKPESYGVFEMEKLLGIDPKQFWAKIDVPGFWDSLPPTDFADDLVAELTLRFDPKDICILTSPSMGAGCIPEKRAWVRRKYPFLEKNILFGSAKRFLAGPDRLLIDDRDENIDDFIAAGGVGIQVPRLWNRLSDFHESPVAYVMAEIEREMGKRRAA
jgi:5'(3')-deoxyribonucleotidase